LQERHRLPPCILEGDQLHRGQGHRERPVAAHPRLQVQDRDGVDRHLRRHPQDHRGRADPQLHFRGGQGLLLQDEGRLPPVSKR
ncbi:unnamed protein product, partial [Ectocarpus sp. 8 AP-2014]